MATRRWGTDALLVVIAAVLVVVWFLVPSNTDEERLAFIDWSDAATTTPAEIHVRRGSTQVALRLRKEASDARRYEVQGRPGALVEPASVDRLIHALSHLEILRLVDPPVTQADPSPLATEIEFQARDGKRRIALGPIAVSPPGARYATLVRSGRSQTVVLDAASSQALDIDPETLLDRRVLDWLPSELRRVTFSDALGLVVIARQDSGRWVLGQSPYARVRRRTLEPLLLALTELSVTKFLDPAIASTALRDASSSRQIELEAKREGRKESLQLRIGGQCPAQKQSLVLLVEGSRRLAGCVEPGFWAKLPSDRETLVDDAAFSFHTDEVERLEVSGLGPSWKLTRREAAFELTTDKTTPVGVSVGNGLLDRLVNVRGQATGRCDFAKQHSGPLLALRSFVVGDDGPTVERVKWDPAPGGSPKRICRDDGIELSLEDQAALLLEIEPTMLRDPNLLDVPVDAITEIQLETPAGRQRLRLDERGKMVLIEPASAAPDPAAIESLLERLAQLRVLGWLSATASGTRARLPNALVEISVVPQNGDEQSSSPPEQSSSPTATAPTATAPTAAIGPTPMQAPATRHQLRVCLDEAQPVVGWWGSDPAPFQLDLALVELLDGLLLDRSLLRLGDTDRAISLLRGTDQIHMTRQNGEWNVAAGKVNRSDAARVIAELETLRALTVYTSSSVPKSLALDTPKDTSLRIEYFVGPASSGKPRLSYEIGARFDRRGIRVRKATLSHPRLTFLIRDEALATTLHTIGEH